MTISCYWRTTQKNDDKDDDINELDELSENEQVHLLIDYLLFANPTDTTALVRYHPFDDNRPPHMAPHLLGTQPQEEAHAL